MSIFEINPDIRRAETLASDFYTDERYFDESKEKIFARTWQMVGHRDEVENLLPHTMLERFLDEPVLLVRDGGGSEFRCLSNVCTHRGKILIESACQANLIRCGYHGRRFDLGGKFLSMPEFERVENFPSKKEDLPQIASGRWENLLFASLAPIRPLADFTANLTETLAPIDLANLQFASTQDYEVKAHWALYCENYLEGFHIPFVHQSLNEAIDFAGYTTETFRFSSLQTGLAKRAEDGFDFDGRRAAFYFFVFPNLMLNFYPWGLSVNVVKPQTPDLTRVTYLTFVSDESKLNVGAGANLDRVELEDQKVVEAVQKGIRSRFYQKGRYSPRREQGTHHFHRLIAEFMN